MLPLFWLRKTKRFASMWAKYWPAPITALNALNKADALAALGKKDDVMAVLLLADDKHLSREEKKRKAELVASLHHSDEEK